MHPAFYSISEEPFEWPLRLSWVQLFPDSDGPDGNRKIFLFHVRREGDGLCGK